MNKVKLKSKKVFELSFLVVIIILVLLFLNIENEKSCINQTELQKFIAGKRLGNSRGKLTLILKGLSNYPVYREYFDNGILYWFDNNQRENIVIKYYSNIKNVNDHIYKFNGLSFPLYSEKYLKYIVKSEILYKKEWIDKNPKVLKGDPVNIVFIVKDRQSLIDAFKISGWTQPGLLNYFKNPFFNENSFPISDLYLWKRSQDLGFSENTSLTLRYRNHIRLWQSSIKENNCEVWVGGATEDIGIEESRFGFRNDLTTHKISPDVDKERDYLQKIFKKKLAFIKTNYISSGSKQLIETVNGNLDPFVWDGRLLIIDISNFKIWGYLPIKNK